MKLKEFIDAGYSYTADWTTTTHKKGKPATDKIISLSKSVAEIPMHTTDSKTKTEITYNLFDRNGEPMAKHLSKENADKFIAKLKSPEKPTIKISVVSVTDNTYNIRDVGLPLTKEDMWLLKNANKYSITRIDTVVEFTAINEAVFGNKSGVDFKKMPTADVLLKLNDLARSFKQDHIYNIGDLTKYVIDSPIINKLADYKLKLYPLNIENVNILLKNASPTDAINSYMQSKHFDKNDEYVTLVDNTLESFDITGVEKAYFGSLHFKNHLLHDYLRIKAYQERAIKLNCEKTLDKQKQHNKSNKIKQNVSNLSCQNLQDIYEEIIKATKNAKSKSDVDPSHALSDYINNYQRDFIKFLFELLDKQVRRSK